MRRGKINALAIAAGLLLTETTSQAAGAAARPAAGVRVAAATAIYPAVPPKISALAGFVDFNPSGPTHFPFYDTLGNGVGVTPTGTLGQYQVVFQNLGFTGGDAQLTAGSGACVIQSWAKMAADLAVNVDCFDGLGTPANQPFDLTVTKPVRKLSGVLDYALVPANGKGLAKAFQFNSSGKANKVTHLSKGQYLLTMPGPGTSGASAGTVKISAYGNVPASCQLAKWQGTKTGQLLHVDCFALTGARMDMGFTVVYARGTNVMGQNGLADANALASRSADLYQPAVQYDSRRGARVSIGHLEAGLYLFVPAGTDVTGLTNGGRGDLQITSLGSSYAACGFSIVRTHHLPLIVVPCFNQMGNQVNAAFTVQWAVR
jgi:hypothetical protein